jgi:hypothetical protein
MYLTSDYEHKFLTSSNTFPGQGPFNASFAVYTTRWQHKLPYPHLRTDITTSFLILNQEKSDCKELKN